MFKYQIDPYATHQPVLYTIASATTIGGNVIEFGTGLYSTHMLHNLAVDGHFNVYSYENNEKWNLNFKRLECEFHKVITIDSWNTTIQRILNDNIYYDLIFVDQAPWEARLESIKHLSNKSKYIILHDCDYFERELGVDYNTYFKYFHIYNIKYQTLSLSPPTLLASNQCSCNIKITFP